MKSIQKVVIPQKDSKVTNIMIVILESDGDKGLALSFSNFSLTEGIGLRFRWLGEREDKFGSDAFGADDVDVFVVGLDNFFGDGEA